MMRILLVGINAKFIHSNLAIRMLQQYVDASAHSVEVREFTINQLVADILSEIYEMDCDLVGFSCYIWNIEYVKRLVRALKKVKPAVKILLGGPEVSYDGVSVMEDLPGVDYIICGEGEEAFRQLLTVEPLSEVQGLIYRENGEILANAGGAAMDMDRLPFVYGEGFGDLENRILYYETTRGCPFNCQYCLSSIEAGVRYRSVELVKKEFQFFLDHKVRQVKLVDRTFNCKKSHALEIWKYLNENDNGVTNFHFEISADLLDDETIDYLKTVRKGLFQFEIGVQSTNEDTLDIIKRRTDFRQLADTVIRLKAAGNIHLHLDLIAGLPNEDYDSFARSFDDVYGLEPEQLQLGFLKILKGSGMADMCARYAIEYHDEAPYEVLSTHVLPYPALLRLKRVEEMVELYYNSGQYAHAMRYLNGFFETPFGLYEAMADYYHASGHFKVSHSKLGVMTILREFAATVPEMDAALFEDLLKMELCLQEKVKRYPEWMHLVEGDKDAINNLYKDEEWIARHVPTLISYQSRQRSRVSHIEIFDYNVAACTTPDDGVMEIIKERTALLFDYLDRDRMDNHASFLNVTKVLETHAKGRT